MTIDSKELMYSGNNDECYTPDYGVTPILKYIPKDAKVWCPFDTAESEFVKQISQTHSVEYSHIDEGKDFLQWNHSIGMSLYPIHRLQISASSSSGRCHSTNHLR